MGKSIRKAFSSLVKEGQSVKISARGLSETTTGKIVFVSPLVDKMVVLTVDPKERARIQSILYVGIILLTSPFGWIAGTLSEVNKNLPFALNISLFVIGAVLAYLAGKAAQKRQGSNAITIL